MAAGLKPSDPHMILLKTDRIGTKGAFSFMLFSFFMEEDFTLKTPADIPGHLISQDCEVTLSRTSMLVTGEGTGIVLTG